MHSQPSIWSNFVSIYRTVAVVDLVAYSSLARILEENTSAAAVAELNHKIQDLIQEALRPLSCTSYSLMAKTGDGALILFEDPACAHEFAVGLHACSARHNMGRSETSARRFFRIGLASGEITVTEPVVGPPEYAGITIANAVRLESAAGPGEVLVDLATFESLPPALQACYSAEFLVRGKREETFRVRKWRIDSASAECAPAPTISRRRALSLGLGATAAAGLGCWGLGSAHFAYWLHPLPARRWVAFAAWPEPAAEIAAVTRDMLSSVREAMHRLESVDHAFAVVDTDEMADLQPTAQPLPPLESAQKFGATLAMLAAAAVADNHLHVSLQVMDTGTRNTLRRATLSSHMDDLAALRERVAPTVAALLGLPTRMAPLEDEQEIALLPASAYRLYTEGKALGSDFNGPRRAEGIEKLQDLVNDYPRFSAGYSELASAYMQDFRTSRDPAMLELAKRNAVQALRLNPDSGVGLLISANIAAAVGNPGEASTYLKKIFIRDPHNPEALLYQAHVYRELGDGAGEIYAYKQILASRPNYWRAYNDCGEYLQKHAKYEEAISAFQMASHMAPNVMLPLTNLGSLYLETGNKDAARQAYTRSVAVFPTAFAYMGLGTIDFSQKDYKGALQAYRNALKLTPRSHDLYRDVGDCQTMLGQPTASKGSFEHAAALLTDELTINPSSGSNWMTLSFYHAKIGAFRQAVADLTRAEQYGAHDLDTLFTKAQVFAVLGRPDECLDILTSCMNKGLSTADVALAVDLRDIVSSPQYQARLAKLQRGKPIRAIN